MKRLDKRYRPIFAIIAIIIVLPIIFKGRLFTYTRTVDIIATIVYVLNIIVGAVLVSKIIKSRAEEEKK